MINKGKKIKTWYINIFFIAFIVLTFMINRNISFGRIFFYETIPFYSIKGNVFLLNNLTDDNNDLFGSISNFFAGSVSKDYSVNDIIGFDEIIFQHESDNSNIEANLKKQELTIDDIENMRDLNFLRSNFYTVDRRTGMTEQDFNVDLFLNKDLTISKTSNEPKILILHTHPHEMYSDSKDISEGVISVGKELARILEQKYGIKTIHDTQRYDLVDGKTNLLGAYERMEVSAMKILEENPSIEILLDIHRDGVPETTKLVTDINEASHAKIMFVNGLSKIMENGVLKDIPHLPNDYKDTNLAFSFQMQLMANKHYPGLTRKVYLNAFRYSLHMLPKSLLVELGAQTNTKEEALNSAAILAELLASVILK